MSVIILNVMTMCRTSMDSIKKKMESLATEKEAATARANKFEEEAMSWGR
jgi:hypothetical protein